jgi:hypothetical protein
MSRSEVSYEHYIYGKKKVGEGDFFKTDSGIISMQHDSRCDIGHLPVCQVRRRAEDPGTAPLSA